jgi:hypothetical protein
MRTASIRWQKPVKAGEVYPDQDTLVEGARKLRPAVHRQYQIDPSK